MKLILGIGNYGDIYRDTRHNSGFQAIDLVSEDLQIPITKHDFKCLYGKGKAFEEDVILMKPLTYVNLSGDALIQVKNFYKVDIKDIPSPSLSNLPACGRVNLKGRRIEKIDGNFELVSQGMSEEEKDQECSRCLRCDHFGLGSVVGGRKTSW